MLTKLRCVFCHDDLTGNSWACNCGAVYHKDCTPDICASCYLQLRPRYSDSTLISKKITDLQLEACRQTIYNHPNFKEAYDVAQANTTGSVWLVGGMVYRNLIKVVHNIPLKEDCDFDFATLHINRRIKIPRKWQQDTTGYGDLSSPFYHQKEKGSVRLTRSKNYAGKPNLTIDLFRFDTFVESKQNTLTDYLNRTPLNIQAIALDIEEDLIIGLNAFDAISRKTIVVNNQEAAQNHANRLRITVPQVIWRKANSVGFLSNQIRNDCDSKTATI